MAFFLSTTEQMQLDGYCSELILVRGAYDKFPDFFRIGI